MANDPFIIRTGPSGPEMPVGTPTYVLTVQADGRSVAPAPPGGAGGSITPLTGALVADRAGAATAPDGSWSGAQAFNGATALQTAVAGLLVTGGAVELAPGVYDEDFTITGQAVLLQGLGAAPVLGSVATVAARSVIDGVLALAGGSLTIDGCVVPAAINDSASGAAVNLRNCAAGDSVTITGPHSILNSSEGVTHCGACTAQGSQVSGDLHCASLQAFDSQFAAVVTSGAGPSSLYTSTFGSFTDQDTMVASDCSFDNLHPSTGGNHLCQLIGCIVKVSVDADCDLDASTEKRSLAAGCTFANRMVALSEGQGGDALFITGNDNPAFDAETRRVVGQLAADATITIGLGSSQPLQKFYVDVWNHAAHDTIVKFGGDTLVTAGPSSAGQGVRYTVQVVDTGDSLVFVGAENL